MTRQARRSISICARSRWNPRTPVAAEEPEGKRAGRPKLGVVAREVTLLPRHWEWLASQSGGASVTLRKLVDTARRAEGDQGAARRAREAADRFMGAMLGNALIMRMPRAPCTGATVSASMNSRMGWPADLRDHARRLAAPSFGKRLRTRRRELLT